MKYILWLELDGFYIEDSTHEPLVVIRGKTVLDANVRAQTKGISVGMDVSQVRNLCPECRKKLWRECDYLEKQHQWMDLCVPFTGVIEPLDGHLAALDLSGHPYPFDIAERVVSCLVQELGLPLHYGAGPSKWIARLASLSHELRKAIIDPGGFIGSLNVQDLAPIPWEHRERLAFLGYHKIADLATLPLDLLQSQFGEHALKIHQASRGGIYEAVRPIYPPNVIRECLLYEDRVEEEGIVDQTLMKLASRISRRLAGKQASEIELSLFQEDGRALRQGRRFTRPVHSASSLLGALRVLFANRQDLEQKGITGIGVVLSDIRPLQLRQHQLYESKERLSIETALSSVNKVFGEKAVRVGGQIEVSRRERVLREWRLGTGWR